MNLLSLSTILLTAIIIIYIMHLRRVVPTNEVHIVQRANKTVSYGKDAVDKVGNTYYEFPSWIPFLGITKTILPISVFALDIDAYEAYDKDRLPFVVDIKAFFRITDSNLAAMRVFSFDELQDQLLGIVQGAARSILAKQDLESIMCERNIYGEQFTNEVAEQLKQWGVETVKNIELMDIRDTGGSYVIANIMEKKKSEIEKESRVTVANNLKNAKTAEIEAKQEVELRQQEAEQQIGLKNAKVEQEVGIAKEKSQQLVQEQAKLTAEKEMEVLKVKEVQTAEISKKANVVNAEANKEISILDAEAKKEKQKLEAEAALILTTKNSEGIKIEGQAKGEAIKAEGLAKAESEKQLAKAPVSAQIELAKEIGSNEAYQKYLLGVEQINANKEIGIAQASNLKNADIKIFATSGSVSEGVSASGNILSPKSGLDLASVIESFTSTPTGKAIANTIGNKLNKKDE